MIRYVVYDKVKIKHAVLTRKRRVSDNTVLCLGVSVSSLEVADRSSRNLVRLKFIPPVPVAVRSKA